MNIVQCQGDDETRLNDARLLIRRYAASLPFCIDLNVLDRESQKYTDRHGALLVAYIDDIAVGVVALRRVGKTDCCEMKRLFVLPEYRGRDIGAELIRALQHTARQKGYRRIRLDTHGPSMGAAIALYQRLGFREVGKPPDITVDPPDEIAVDLVFMECEIDPSL